MGRGLIAQCQKEFIDLRAICDINPKRRRVAAEAMAKAGWPQPKEYEDWREMLQKEDLEATIIATPLWSHAEIAVGCLDAGKHVLCEKMMAKTEAECLRMIDASRRNRRTLEIGYQRYYNPVYQAAYNNIVKQGLSATSISRGWSGTATPTGGARKTRPRPVSIRAGGAIPIGNTC